VLTLNIIGLVYGRIRAKEMLPGIDSSASKAGSLAGSTGWKSR
jgi:hypothetical protein